MVPVSNYNRSNDPPNNMVSLGESTGDATVTMLGKVGERVPKSTKDGAGEKKCLEKDQDGGARKRHLRHLDKNAALRPSSSQGTSDKMMVDSLDGDCKLSTCDSAVPKGSSSSSSKKKNKNDSTNAVPDLVNSPNDSTSSPTVKEEQSVGPDYKAGEDDEAPIEQFENAKEFLAQLSREHKSKKCGLAQVKAEQVHANVHCRQFVADYLAEIDRLYALQGASIDEFLANVRRFHEAPHHAIVRIFFTFFQVRRLMMWSVGI